MCNSEDRVLAPFCVAFSILAIVASAHAHVNRAHKTQEVVKKAVAPYEQEYFETINHEYVKNVKSIFEKSCFDCHSSSTHYPWYAKLPIAKQLIENDIKEAKVHLDFSNDFPFGGHGAPTEDLKAISKIVEDGEMPPFRYWVMHPGTKLNDEEKKAIKAWVDASIDALGEPKSAGANH